MTEDKKTRSELKREAIITGALAAFQQYGVADTSMDKIAELAQVSKRTVYNHFENKEILVAEIIISEWQKRIVTYDESYNANTDIKAQLITLAANEVELMADIKMLELTRVAIAHFLFAPSSLQMQMAKIFEEETALKRWIKSATMDGKLKPLDVNMAANQITGLLKAEALWPQILRQADPLSVEDRAQLVEVSVDMFLSYYLIG